MECGYWQLLALRLASLPVDDPARPTLRNELIEGYLPLADRLAACCAPHGERNDDLVRVARLGLIDAVDRFAPEHGTFLGQAVPVIRAALRHHLAA